MASLEFFVVAESVSVDQVTNKVSVFEVLERTGFKPNTNNAIARCVACSLWRMTAEDIGQDFQVMLKIFQPGEESPRESATNFTANSDRHRVFVHLVGVPIQQPGELRLEVLLNGEHAAEHIIAVVEESQPSDAPN